MMKKPKGVVYCVTSPSGKKYVGISIHGAEHRWARHVKDAIERNSDTLFHRAIRKHGPDAFKIRVLRRSDDWKQLCTWEIEYIAKLKTKAPHGYNCTSGGDANFSFCEETRERISKRTRRTLGDIRYSTKIAKGRLQNWRSPGYRIKRAAALERQWSNPDSVAKWHKSMENVWRNPDRQARAKASAKWLGSNLVRATSSERKSRTAFTQYCRRRNVDPKMARRRLREAGISGRKKLDKYSRAIIDEIKLSNMRKLDMGIDAQIERGEFVPFQTFCRIHNIGKNRAYRAMKKAGIEFRGELTPEVLAVLKTLKITKKRTVAKTMRSETLH